jgi:antibiotic biosynthesis monooxygenase (ABM) superfamily enzyme
VTIIKTVSVIVKRVAKKDKIKDFEVWLSGISKEVSRQEGSMGIDIIRPTSNESKSEYVIIITVNNYDNLTNDKNRQYKMMCYKR